MKPSSLAASLSGLGAIVLAATTSIGSVACFSCTTELRGYAITVDRDIPRATTPLGSVVTVCISGRCREHVVDENGAFRSDQLEGATGSLVATSGGMHLSVSISLMETSADTPITVRARAADGTPLVEVSGEVEWDGVDGCHYEPESRVL